MEPTGTNQPQEPTGAEKPKATLRVIYRDWREHPAQARLILSDNKRIIVRAGRRGGKTVGASQRSVRAFRRGKRVLYGAPTTDQVKKFWFEVKRSLAELIDAEVVTKNESEHFIEVPGTENRIRCKTCWNADMLRGDYADLLILDEWQLMSEDTWEDVGAPMLMDNDGDAVFIYTPPSLQSASVTKAKDSRHAAKMYEHAIEEMAAAEKEGRKSRWLAIHWASTDSPFLNEAGLEEVVKDMTVASYRREVLALDANVVPGALWSAEMIEATRVSFDQVPDLETVVVGVDPTGSSTNEAGIVACGKGEAPRGWKPTPEILAICPDVLAKKHMYVLFDRSRKAPTSHEWAQAAVELYFDARADVLLGERNYGGDMVAFTITKVDNGDKVMYQDVVATRGKQVRAAPIAAATERGLVHIVGSMPELEDELTSYVPGNASPNRMDACLVGDTLVETDGGEKRIDAIRAGDFVVTRRGLRRVLHAEKTGTSIKVRRVEFSNGRSLVGTANHPVWVDGRGFVELDALVCGSIALCIRPQSFLTDSNIQGIPRRSSGRIASTIDTVAGAIQDYFTRKFGSLLTGGFLVGSASTTSTAIHSTMSWRISSVSRRSSMLENMRQRIASGDVGISSELESSRLCGMEVETVGCGTENTLDACGRRRRASYSERSASSAARRLGVFTKIRDFVAEVAVGSYWIPSTATKFLLTVLRVVRNFGRISIRNVPRLAPSLVLGSYVAGRADVYNLEVEGEHEYFANGILVHNCVWCGTRIIEGLDEGGLIEFFKRLEAHGGDEEALLAEMRAKQRQKAGDALVEKKIVDVFEETKQGQRAAWLAKHGSGGGLTRDFKNRGLFGRFG